MLLAYSNRGGNYQVNQAFRPREDAARTKSFQHRIICMQILESY